MSDEHRGRLESLKRHVAAGEPIDGELDPLADEEASALVAALFALASDERVRRVWADNVDFATTGAMGKVAYAMSESDQVEADLDRMLAGGEAATAARTLARAGIIWDSPHLLELLDDDGSRRAAALIATAARPDEVADWLADCEILEDALQVLRAGALNQVGELAEALDAWREEIEALDGADDERARLEGIAAVLDPDAYARRALAGEAEVAWLSDLPVVADFLQVHGPTEWLEVLGILEVADAQALELACFVAVSAAAGIGYDEPDEKQARRLLDLLAVEPDADAEDWQPLATSLGLGFAIAIAPDDELALLGAQMAAHERLSAFDIHSPGVPGLPLSATYEEGLDLAASRAMLEGMSQLDELHGAGVVAVVRTLSDLRGLLAHDAERFEEHAAAWVEAFLDSQSRAVRLAVRHLLVWLDQEAARREAERLDRLDQIEAALAYGAHRGRKTAVIAALEEHARLQGPIGLDCARRLAAVGSDDALEALARLWESGDLFRVVFYRDCIFEALDLAT